MIRLLLSVVVIVGLILCYFSCEKMTFLIVLIATLVVWVTLSIIEAHYSRGNRARWGRQRPDPREKK